MASEYIYKCIALSHTATHCTVVKKEKLNKLISKKDKMIIYVSYIFSLLSLWKAGWPCDLPTCCLTSLAYSRILAICSLSVLSDWLGSRMTDEWRISMLAFWLTRWPTSLFKINWLNDRINLTECISTWNPVDTLPCKASKLSQRQVIGEVILTVALWPSYYSSYHLPSNIGNIATLRPKIIILYISHTQ